MSDLSARIVELEAELAVAKHRLVQVSAVNVALSDAVDALIYQLESHHDAPDYEALGYPESRAWLDDLDTIGAWVERCRSLIILSSGFELMENGEVRISGPG